tara:strand:- start:280 stop:462 length:183 start_codon:yes stop_codon:yes gene_type:complete
MMIDWQYFLISFFIFISVMMLMSIGFIVVGKRLTGSCGGLGKLMGKDCDFCDKKDQCKKN